MYSSISKSCANPARLIGAVVLTVSLDASEAAADVTSEPLSGVTVEEATAEPAKAGEVSKLRFRLVNSGVSNLTLTGIHSPLSEAGALVLRGPLTGPRDVTTLTILQEEELDLMTSHIWGELRGLKRELATGSFVEFELVFRSGSVSAEAHVH